MSRGAQVREKLWASLEGVDAESLERVAPGEWSILGVLEHLHYTEALVVEGIEMAMTAEPFEGITAQESLETRVHDRTTKVKGPERAEPRGEIGTLAQAKERLEASRADLEQAVAAAAKAGKLTTHGFTHRRFGVLSIQQWYEIVPWHEERHLAQIEEIKAAFKIQ